MQLNHLIIDENNMAFDPTVGSSYQLGGSAQEILELLKEGKNKDEIINVLADKYNTPKEDLYIDISDFLTKLKVYGLIQ